MLEIWKVPLKRLLTACRALSITAKQSKPIKSSQGEQMMSTQTDTYLYFGSEVSNIQKIAETRQKEPESAHTHSCLFPTALTPPPSSAAALLTSLYLSSFFLSLFYLSVLLFTHLPPNSFSLPGPAWPGKSPSLFISPCRLGFYRSQRRNIRCQECSL